MIDPRYKQYGQNLYGQQKRQMRVVKRKKNDNKVKIAILGVALMVGFWFTVAYAFANDSTIYNGGAPEGYWEKSVSVTTDMVNDYNKSLYDATKIDSLESSTIEEYDKLVDAIIANELLRSNDQVAPLDSSRLDTALADYGEFKNKIETDVTDYSNASDADCLNKAISLYYEQKDVLNRQLTEALQNGKYLVDGTTEYTNNKNEIVNIQKKITSLSVDLETVSQLDLEAELEAKAQENNKSK
ncbi:MAG: hypothetical protein WC343_05995 [Bacilli bacterium]